MKNVVSSLLVSGLVTALGGAAAADPSPRVLSFSEVQAIAIKDSPDVAIADQGVVSADERLKAARARRLPTLSVDTNLLLWDKELSFTLALPGMAPPPGMEPEPVVVRSRLTSATNVTIAQPLSAQIVFGNLIKLEKANREAARADQKTSQMDAAYRAADGYLLVLLASAAVEIGKLRVDQLTSQLERARVLASGGVLQPVDTMRLEAAVAAARREVIQAESQVRIAKASLVLYLGLPEGTEIEVVDRFPEQPNGPPLDVKGATGLAAQNRPDLRAVEHRSAQAASAAEVSKASLYPNIVAVGTLQHNEGSGTFQSKNAWFVGVTLKWDLWDWNSRWHTFKETRAKAVQARLGAERFGDVIRVEVEQATLAAQSAHESLDVARIGRAASEEAFRIQSQRFQEGVATTTDLLDAQTEVTQARIGYASARFSYFRALVALAHVTGQLPDAVMAGI